MPMLRLLTLNFADEARIPSVGRKMQVSHHSRRIQATRCSTVWPARCSCRGGIMVIVTTRTAKQREHRKLLTKHSDDDDVTIAHGERDKRLDTLMMLSMLIVQMLRIRSSFSILRVLADVR
jgi:hypothetical protein